MLLKSYPIKKVLWDYLHFIIDNWAGEVVIMGDFNEVHTQDERFGSIFNIQGAAIFNSFISSSGLVDVPMGRCSFTWVHKSAAKMSKLDRFLISEGLMESCPNISATSLDRYLSDHRPILLRELCFDYGPTPFRFYHYWFELEGFDKFMEQVWNDYQSDDSNVMLRFMNKLKYLKTKLRSWTNTKKESLTYQNTKLKSTMIDIDKTIDARYANSDLLNNRKNVMTSLLDMEKIKSSEVAQKSKIKWSIEGDENSKFFHGILNKKRNNLAIRGILVDGVWIDSPSMVKDEFLSHFKNRFDCPSSTRLSLVWDCGMDKSPEPDGFTFRFYQRYWSLLEKDVIEAVSYFFQHGEKKMLWDYLSHVIAQWAGEVVVMGDFNEVRKKDERFGSVFNVHGANAFNLFISNAGLEEVPLGGCSYTWCHKSASKMSKLDRFLISESLMNSCPNISAITLERFLSDHRPILMRESHYDYGPVPFRFFHYWFEIKGFDKFVEDSWKEAVVVEPNAMTKLMKKLKHLKEKIRLWNKENTMSSINRKRTLKSDLADLDLIIDKGCGDVEIVNKRANVVRSLQELENLQSLEAAQKSKIKWAIEGDENSMYYHGILNKKEPDQIIDLECDVSKDEIKRAVWDCGTDKSPGLDGFTFGSNSSFIALILKTRDANMVKDFRPISLIGSMYKITGKIMVNRLVLVLGDLVNEVQSAFIVDRQILDGPFILNEIIQWCQSKKKQSLVFKVDFEKAFDSVRWDYLDEILRRGSVIVNGSPTEEFQFHKGLKHGDPLSPFLFILVMESLHISFQRIVDAGMFK
ncbi:RNA-directed DNA polymerase, eukaryota, partial [Tanacetum coccineum]